MITRILFSPDKSYRLTNGRNKPEVSVRLPVLLKQPDPSFAIPLFRDFMSPINV